MCILTVSCNPACRILQMHYLYVLCFILLQSPYQYEFPPETVDLCTVNVQNMYRRPVISFFFTFIEQRKLRYIIAAADVEILSVETAN